MKMTKQDLLTAMASKRACDGATNFVRQSPHNDAKAIWLSCDRVDWLCWLAFRHLPMGSFANECADRAVRQYAPGALRACGKTAEADKLASLPPIVDQASARVARAAYAAANAAAYAAAAAAAATAAAYDAADAAADATAAAYDAADAAAYAYATADAAAYAAAAADAAADAAAYAAAAADADADAAADAERALQLKHLHGLWPTLAGVLTKAA